MKRFSLTLALLGGKGCTVVLGKEKHMQPTDRILAAAMTPNVPHGAFRLYVILDAASREAGAENEFFPVTLEGLMLLHPGIAGRNAGATTIIKQIAALRGAGLLETRAAMHRNEPRMPVLVKLLPPQAGPEPELVSVASIANSQ